MLFCLNLFQVKISFAPPQLCSMKKSKVTLNDYTRMSPVFLTLIWSVVIKRGLWQSNLQFPF